MSCRSHSALYSRRVASPGNHRVHIISNSFFAAFAKGRWRLFVYTMRRDTHRLRNLCDSISANWINKSEDFTRRLAGRASLRQRVQTGTAGVVARAAINKAAGTPDCRGWSSRLKVSYANPRAERIYCLPPRVQECAQGVDPHQALKGGKRELWSAIAANHDRMWPLGPSGLTSKALSRKFALA